MTTITIDLSEDRLKKLKELAGQFKVAPEELVRVSVEEALGRTEDEFGRVLDYLLQKNAELYRKLA